MPLSGLCRLARAVAAIALAAPAAAQTYPSKPIRTIVSIAAGSVTDVIMRAAANELAPRLGQPLVIENNGGASGIMAGQSCAGATPDGHTICVVYHSTLSFNPHLFNKLPYDADKDFDLVTRLFFLIEGLAVSNGSGVASVAELKAAVAAKPEAFNFGKLGCGSGPVPHLARQPVAVEDPRPAVPWRGTDRAGAGFRRHPGRQDGRRRPPRPSSLPSCRMTARRPQGSSSLATPRARTSRRRMPRRSSALHLPSISASITPEPSA